VAVGALEVDLCNLLVLEHGDTALAGIDRYEQLALGGRKRCPARRLASAPAAIAARRGAPLGSL
jgi:hypothetical protein